MCLNYELHGQDFVAGYKITIADHCLVSSVSTIMESAIDVAKYENIITWLAKCKSKMAGYDEINEPGAQEFGEMVKSKFIAY